MSPLVIALAQADSIESRSFRPACKRLPEVCISAHRSILASRSEYFRAMLAGPFRESLLAIPRCHRALQLSVSFSQPALPRRFVEQNTTGSMLTKILVDLLDPFACRRREGSTRCACEELETEVPLPNGIAPSSTSPSRWKLSGKCSASCTATMALTSHPLTKIMRLQLNSFRTILSNFC